MLGLPWPLPFPGFNLYFVFSVISMTIILLTSGSPSSELLTLRVVSGDLELHGISGAVTTDVSRPLARTAMTVGITHVHFLLSWTPQNMMLRSMVQRSREKQQDPLWTRVKLLRAEQLQMEYQMCPSRKSMEVFMKNRWLWTGRERGPGI